jgi:putative ATPase
MLEAGEDPRFIVRRLAILASEDVGNADPNALAMAHAAWALVERIGMPEARITLGQLVCYLACAPKSNASYVAIDRALEDVRTGRVLAVPMEIRDPNSSPVAGGSDGVGRRTKERAASDGKRYEYSHGERDVITGQDYLGVEKRYYEPGQAGAEAAMREVVDRVRGRRRERRGGGPDGEGDGGGDGGAVGGGGRR